VATPVARKSVDRSAPMPLREHLAELRTRLLISAMAIAVCSIAGWVFFDEIFGWITGPFVDVVQEAQQDGKNIQLALTGVTDPFVLQIKVAAVSGVVLASPIWLFQLWRFVTPGLHRNERAWALGFAAIATPLFLAGVALAYLFLPQALGFLFGFTPDDVSNIIDVTRYLTFFLRTILVFGAGFLLPLLALLLNLAGVLSAKAFIGAWRWLVLGVFVFAAMATPDGSPLTMTVLALPILALFGLAMLLTWLNDRRRGAATLVLNDDEASPAPAGPEPLEDPEPPPVR
jgi:sec-independent protein translocase protein TatC